MCGCLLITEVGRERERSASEKVVILGDVYIYSLY